MDLHYVYYAIKEDGTPKVGATKNPTERNSRAKYESIKLLEVYDCPWKCGDREIELQLQYFGKRDSNTHYAVMIKRGHNKATHKKISKGLKLAYKEGRRDKIDKSFFNKKEYRKKISNVMKKWCKDNPNARKKSARYGSDNHNTRYTEDDVRFIRKHYYPMKNQNTPIPAGKMSRKEIIDTLGCTVSFFKQVVTNKTWKHVK